MFKKPFIHEGLIYEPVRIGLAQASGGYYRGYYNMQFFRVFMPYCNNRMALALCFYVKCRKKEVNRQLVVDSFWRFMGSGQSKNLVRCNKVPKHYLNFNYDRLI